MGHSRFKRSTGPRKAMLRDLVTDVILHRRIKTTEAKARAVQPIVEKMISLAKRGDLHARRRAAAFVYKRRSITEFKEGSRVPKQQWQTHERHVDAVRILFDEVGPQYEDRKGGYSRVTRIRPRRGDGAMLAYLELV
ncbi:50S ribosomal protein L17 [Pasteuria penetrans]|uniref:50S ribosomal protein L17 n=1 Tax=Pasteuria penetrans TaxID=86005 RepID=UPI000FA86897|nr:50S ribosomal protein L17 [Pasteuria penetrans]